MTKKILVVGSQGYLGSRLTDYLQECGYLCSGVDTGFFKYGVLYHPKPVPMLDKNAHTLSERDLEHFHVVIQLAGVSNDAFGNLKDEVIYQPTRDYAVQIASMCKNLGVRYIFPSSCSVYGIGKNILDEDGPTDPQTSYSSNKLQVEHDLALLADESFSPIALRLATVFGMSPRIRFDVVINMLCGMAVAQNRIILNSDGKAWRPHLDIEEVCEAFRCCIEWDYKAGKLLVLNVGRNDNNMKIIDAALTIQSMVQGCSLKFLDKSPEEQGDNLVKDNKVQDGVDKRTYQVLFDKIHDGLPGFRAKWDMENGILRLITELQRLELDEIKFKQREFYRLQQLEHLYTTGQIDQSLNIK